MTTGRPELATQDYCRWLGQFAILSERVDGRWRHEPFTGGPAWAAYLAKVESRTTAR